MAEEEAAGSLRVTQLTLLGLAGLCLVLATTKPEVQARLEAGRLALGTFPRDSERIASTILDKLDQGRSGSWALDLPSSLTTAWLAERVKNGWLHVRLATPVRLPEPQACAGSSAEAARLLGASVCETVAALTESLDEPGPSITLGMARFHCARGAIDSALEHRAVMAASSFRASRAELKKRQDEARAVCSASQHRVSAYSMLETTAKRLHRACIDTTQAAARQQAAHQVVMDELARVRSEILSQSDRLSQLASAKTGGNDLVAEVVVGSQIRYFSVPDPLRACCRVAPSAPVGSSPLMAECAFPDARPAGSTQAVVASVGSLSRSLSSNLGDDPCAGPWRSGESAIVPIQPDPVLRSGMWSELGESTVAGAEAKLLDAIAKADLEGEVLGVTFAARDALRTLWVPLLATLAYSLWLLRRVPRVSAEGASTPWPLGAWTQGLIHLIGAVGTAASIVWCCRPTMERSATTLSSNTDFLGLCVAGLAAYVIVSRRRPHQDASKS